MSPITILALLALTGYAVYRQSIRHRLSGHDRFRMAIIYGIVGLAIGGFSRPNDATEVALMVASLSVSVLVGLARGRLTRVWRAGDGRFYAQGTPLTIGLFLAMVAFKFGLGTFAYLDHISDDGGFGEIMLMIAIMIAFQAQLVWRRAERLGASSEVASPNVGIQA